MSRRAIPVEERFDDPQGKLPNYDAYDTTQRFRLARQTHVDIRNFDPREFRIRLTMLHLNLMTMSDLATASMNDLAGEVITRLPEQWDIGTVEIMSSYNRWRGLRVSLGPGTTTTTSVIRR